MEQEKAERDREDAITALVQQYSYLTPEILRAFGDVTLDELKQRASMLNAAIHERENPRDRMGRGGLDPTQPAGRHVTWPSAFQRARENRRKGGSGLTYLSDSRYSGEV